MARVVVMVVGVGCGRWSRRSATCGVASTIAGGRRVAEAGGPLGAGADGGGGAELPADVVWEVWRAGERLHGGLQTAGSQGCGGAGVTLQLGMGPKGEGNRAGHL